MSDIVEDIHRMWLQSEPSPWEIVEYQRRKPAQIYAPECYLGEVCHFPTAEFICLVGNKWHRVYEEIVKLRAEVAALKEVARG